MSVPFAGGPAPGDSWRAAAKWGATLPACLLPPPTPTSTSLVWVQLKLVTKRLPAPGSEVGTPVLALEVAWWSVTSPRARMLKNTHTHTHLGGMLLGHLLSSCEHGRRAAALTLQISHLFFYAVPANRQTNPWLDWSLSVSSRPWPAPRSPRRPLAIRVGATITYCTFTSTISLERSMCVTTQKTYQLT